MNRAQAIFLAIVAGGGVLWALAGLVPPSKDAARSAFEQATADGSAHFDAAYNTVWSVRGHFGLVWTCKVELDAVADIRFIDDGSYECSPWPWADGSRRGPGDPVGAPPGG